MSNIAICLDLETVGKDSAPVACTATSDIVQIGCIPVDLDRLEVIEEDFLNLIVKPKDFKSKTFEQDYSRVIDFHCKNLNKTKAELIKMWSMGLTEINALKELTSYAKSFGSKPTLLTHNGRNFDEPILKRKYKEYKKAYPFQFKGHIDTMDVFGWYFRYATNKPKNFKLDDVLPFLGISSDGSHDALVDVRNTATVALKFLGVQKALMSHDVGWVRAINGANAL